MPGPLGSGTNTAGIYTRGGGTELLSLGALSALEYHRTRNVIGTASVTVTPDDDNWSSLGDVHGWAHELVIHRDGARVWEGPLRNPVFSSGQVVFPAVDVLGWLTKRAIKQARQILTPTAVSAEGQLIIERAFAVHDPNVLPHLLVIPHADEAKVTRDVAAYSGMYDGDLTGLADQGLNFTVIGRRVIIWPDEILLGRTDTLIPERDTTASVEVRENSDDAATAVTAVNQSGTRATAIAANADVNATTGVSDFYGLLERIISADNVITTTALGAVATAAVNQVYPAPNVVEMPSGSLLKPEAPFKFSELVPGVLVPVETSATPRRASGTLILDEVNVSQSAEGGEQITVGFAQASAVAGSVEA